MSTDRARYSGHVTQSYRSLFDIVDIVYIPLLSVTSSVLSVNQEISVVRNMNLLRRKSHESPLGATVTVLQLARVDRVELRRSTPPPTGFNNIKFSFFLLEP